MQTPGWQPTSCVTWCLIWLFASLKKYGHIWHQMSLLRPGVIKQHKTKPKHVTQKSATTDPTLDPGTHYGWMDQGSVEYAKFAQYFYTWAALGIEPQTFWSGVQCPMHLTTYTLAPRLKLIFSLGYIQGNMVSDNDELHLLGMTRILPRLCKRCPSRGVPGGVLDEFSMLC